MCTTKLHTQTKLDHLIFKVSRLADELAYARGLNASDVICTRALAAEDLTHATLVKERNDPADQAVTDEADQFEHFVSALENMLDALSLRVSHLDTRISELTGSFVNRSDEYNSRIRSLERGLEP